MSSIYILSIKIIIGKCYQHHGEEVEDFHEDSNRFEQLCYGVLGCDRVALILPPSVVIPSIGDLKFTENRIIILHLSGYPLSLLPTVRRI